MTLAENDPGQYDLKFWLDYFRKVQIDARARFIPNTGGGALSDLDMKAVG